MSGSYKEIKQKIAALEEEAAIAREREVAEVIIKVQELIKEYDLTAEDLGFKKSDLSNTSVTAKVQKRQPKPPKYRDPVSGSTWNGIGKTPKWVIEADKAGKRDDLLIEKPAAKPESKDKKPVAAIVVQGKNAATPKAAKQPAADASSKKQATKKEAPKPEAKPAAKAATKPAAKTAGKGTAKTAAKPAATTAAKSAPKAASKTAKPVEQSASPTEAPSGAAIPMVDITPPGQG